jgi:hypothetical protein
MSWTNWIMWLGWLVLFASGVLFGFGVARAEAAEAWVLWQKINFYWSDGTFSSKWDVVAAEPSPAGCEAQSRNLLGGEPYYNRTWSFYPNGSQVDLVSRDGDRAVKVYVCLPATIDPRPR